jgi:hypothetical protein
MTVGKSRGPASPADVVGMLLVQEGRGDEALLLARSDSSGRLISVGEQWAKQWPTHSRAVRSAAEWWEGKSEVGDGFLDDVRRSDKEGPTHVGGDDRRPPAPSALHAVSAATRNRGGGWDRVTVSCSQTEKGR